MRDRTSRSSKESARTAREKRLAEALRANLRRRKSTSREGEGAGKASSPVEKAPRPGRRGD